MSQYVAHVRARRGRMQKNHIFSASAKCILTAKNYTNQKIYNKQRANELQIIEIIYTRRNDKENLNI